MRAEASAESDSAMAGAASVQENSSWMMPSGAMPPGAMPGAHPFSAFQQLMPEMLKAQEEFFNAVASSGSPTVLDPLSAPGFLDFEATFNDPEFKELTAARIRDVEALGNPGTSEEEVRAFLDRLTEIASTQRHYGTGMPEPEALKKLRPEDLPILLEYIDTPLGGHMPQAIAALATEEHKDLLIKVFERHAELAPTIEKLGLAPLCGDAIARHMRKASSLEKRDWARIGVASGAPIVYREMIESYFDTGIFGGQPIYEAAATAPDFPLETFHERIWDEHGDAPLDDDAIQMLASNIENGSVRALDIAARAFTNDGFQFSDRGRYEGDKRHLEGVIRRATPSDWNYDLIIAQRDAIAYDKDTRKFRLAADSES